MLFKTILFVATVIIGALLIKKELKEFDKWCKEQNEANTGTIS